MKRLTRFVSLLEIDENFVELVVDAITSLVEGRDDSSLLLVCVLSKDAGKVKGVGCVETSGTVVPALNGSLRAHDLGNRDSLPLTTRHTSNILIADDCIMDVANAK
ncbi:hypothetical protein HG531_005909 [Fusarium graminearum]|nr:hypothetical protein HG531_005909 [Fusarium graminearum]